MLPVPEEILKMKPHDAFTMGQTMGLMMGLILGVIAVAIALDARELGWSRVAALMWGVAVQAAALPVLIYYFFVRTRSRARLQLRAQGEATAVGVKTCRYCQKSYAGDPAYCPHCSSQLKGAEEIHKSA